MSYKIIIYGHPVVQKRARQGKYGFYDPSAQQRKVLSLQLLAECVRTGLNSCLTGDLSLTICFYCKRHGARKIDVSNMLKALEDSGNGIVWADDSQITHLNISRIDCELSEERTELEIFNADELRP